MMKAKISILIAFLIPIIMIPTAAFAVDQSTVDTMIFLIQQPDWDLWDEQPFDDVTLIEGLDAVYEQSGEDGDTLLQSEAVYAMGETGLNVFAPTIIAHLEFDPVPSCYALGKLTSNDGVTALIEFLDDDDKFVREAAIVAIGSISYSSMIVDQSNTALSALHSRLSSETESWLSDKIESAITMINTGVATDPAFE